MAKNSQFLNIFMHVHFAHHCFCLTFLYNCFSPYKYIYHYRACCVEKKLHFGAIFVVVVINARNLISNSLQASHVFGSNSYVVGQEGRVLEAPADYRYLEPDRASLTSRILLA